MFVYFDHQMLVRRGGQIIVFVRRWLAKAALRESQLEHPQPRVQAREPLRARMRFSR